MAAPRSAKLVAVVAAVAAVLLPTYHILSGWGPVSADMVVTNATIWTGDPAQPFAEAMAVRAGRVVRVGVRDEVLKLKGHGFFELVLNGNVVLPGFVDSHVHLLWGGLKMDQVDLYGVQSKDEFVLKIKKATKDRPPGEWIIGGGWNSNSLGGSLPSSSWIDDSTPNNPVWLSQMDGHMGLANSKAMKVSGITRDMKDPVGGKILKSEKGDPTGLLVESAMNLVHSVIPEASLHKKRQALQRASSHALMRGVTTVVDFGSYYPGLSVDLVWQELFDVYKWADSIGEMMIRVCLFFPMPSWPRLADLIHKKGRSLSQWIHIGGVKEFADGSLGSSSALFYEPYEDDAGYTGAQLADTEWLLNTSAEADKHGIQVAVHAIGDKANSIVLDVFKSVASSNGYRDRRFRIEHAQHLALDSTRRFGEEHIIASVQPNHLLDDASLAERKIGVQRAHKSSYVFNSLLADGAQLAFGSDWPVVDINPLKAIKTSMYRIPDRMDKTWVYHECISLDDALKAHTISAAYACFLDHDLGSLSNGKYADFVVLPATSWQEFSQGVAEEVLATYVGGKKAYP